MRFEERMRRIAHEEKLKREEEALKLKEEEKEAVPSPSPEVEPEVVEETVPEAPVFAAQASPPDVSDPIEEIPVIEEAKASSEKTKKKKVK